MILSGSKCTDIPATGSFGDQTKLWHRSPESLIAKHYTHGLCQERTTTFEFVDEMLHELLKMIKGEFKVDKIGLLGGIVINTDFGIDDYFSVCNFEIIRTRYL